MRSRTRAATHGCVRNGAVKRIKLEAGEAPITYEAFVEELDEGDSFTATLVEVLVKVRSSSPMGFVFGQILPGH